MRQDDKLMSVAAEPRANASFYEFYSSGSNVV
jgi:hypothetical protein